MHFYKVFKQMKNNQSAFYELLNTDQYKCLKGNNPSSFAISYNPEKFNRFLQDNELFREFNRRSVKQLFVTNQKFIAILKNEDFFDLKVIDCQFDEGEIDELCYDDDITAELIEDIICRYSYTIKQLTYRTNSRKSQLIIQKNGVIGFDNQFSDIEYSHLFKLIDTLNLGLKEIHQ